MTLRASRALVLLPLFALGPMLASCGDGGGAQILDATWFPSCEDTPPPCTDGDENVAFGVAGSEVTGECTIQRAADFSILNFRAAANGPGNGQIQIQNLRYNADFSVVGDTCNVSFVEDGAPYGTGSVSDTFGRCGPAVPSAGQPCQVLGLEEVAAGEAGLGRTPFGTITAEFGDEIRLEVVCSSVGNPNSPGTDRYSLRFARARQTLGDGAVIRGVNCTEITP